MMRSAGAMTSLLRVPTPAQGRPQLPSGGGNDVFKVKMTQGCCRCQNLNTHTHIFVVVVLI